MRNYSRAAASRQMDQPEKHGTRIPSRDTETPGGCSENLEKASRAHSTANTHGHDGVLGTTRLSLE
jgi:hypothetical protein